MTRLAGKVAIISGAGVGIGRSAAILFAQHGARVAIAEIDPQTGAETERLAREAGGEAMFIETDVTKPDSVIAAIDTSNGSVRFCSRSCWPSSPSVSATSSGC